MKFTKLICFVSLGAVLALLFACGEQVTNVSEKEGPEKVSKYKELSKCVKDNVGSLVYVSDSARVFACTEDGWVSLNGTDGKDGSKGDKGDAGKDGTSCVAKKLSSGDGYKILCAGDSVGVILNGQKSGDGNGKDGDKGEDGEDGIGCVVEDNLDGTITVTCDTSSAILYKSVCGRVPYDPEYMFCNSGVLYYADSTQAAVCGTKVYDPEKYICNLGIALQEKKN